MSKQNIAIIGIIMLVLVISGFSFFANTDKDNSNKDNVKISGMENEASQEENANKKEVNFGGEKGESLKIENGETAIAVKDLNNEPARFYNAKLENGKTIYFFVVKDKNGTYRAAANACQVCHDARMGFVQEGDYMKCRTCGNKYPLEKIATEKGGCNPGPINPNLKVKDDKIIIQEMELEEVAELF